MKLASAKTTSELWVLRQAYPSHLLGSNLLNHDSDGDSFDDIFSAHVLELGRNTERRIVGDRHLRHKHGYPRRCASESASMASACRRGWARPFQAMGPRLEWSEQLEIVKISLTRYVWISKVTMPPIQLGVWEATVILDRDPKSMIGCPSGCRTVQSFMMAVGVSIPATNSFSWIECSGKAAWKVFSAAPVVWTPISMYLRLTQGIRSDTTKLLILVTLKWVRVGRCKRWSNAGRIEVLLQSSPSLDLSLYRTVRDSSLEIRLNESWIEGLVKSAISML